MISKASKADVAFLRQTTQFTCCATSITSALHALGKRVTEEDVNKVLGASPMAGATWEAMLATVQYFGCRGTLVVPATPRMLKNWTDQGIPVVIAWNPEGRPWSHASTVYDVQEDVNGKLQIYVMDSNIPNPSETTRVLDEDAFCQKWGEKVSDTLIVRRPAMAVTLEVDRQGRQVIASNRNAHQVGVYHSHKGWVINERVYRDIPANATIEDLVEVAKSEYPKATVIRSVNETWCEAGSCKLHVKPFLPNGKQFFDLKGDHMKRSEMAQRIARTYLAKAPMMVKEKTKTPKDKLVIKKEDLPANRFGPEIVQMYNRKTKFTDPSADYARGHKRQPKHRKDYE